MKEETVWYKFLHHDKHTTLEAGDRLLVNLDSGVMMITRDIVNLRFQNIEMDHTDSQLFFGTGLTPAIIHALLALMCMLSGLHAELVEGGGRIYLFEFQKPPKEN